MKFFLVYLELFKICVIPFLSYQNVFYIIYRSKLVLTKIKYLISMKKKIELGQNTFLLNILI